MKIALLQLNPLLGAVDENARDLIQAVRQAAKDGADLCLAPELALCGYIPNDLLLLPHFLEKCRKKLYYLAEKLADLPHLLLGAPLPGADAPLGEGALNAAVFLHEGKVDILCSKMFLPNYDVCNESRYFAPGVAPGLLAFKDRRFAVLLGEDLLRSLEPTHGNATNSLAGSNVGRMLQTLEPDGIINLSSWPYAHNLSDKLTLELSDMARHYQTPLLWVNSAGGNDGLIFSGRSACYGADGALRGEAVAFQPEVKIIDLPDESAQNGQHGVGTEKSLSFEHEIRISALTQSLFSFSSGTDKANYSEIWQALKLGLKDFVEKSIPSYSIPKVIIGLSGGVDSALVAALAAQAFDPADVLAVTMPSAFNSAGTRQDAADLAAILGLEFRVIPIEETLSAYKSMLGYATPDSTEKAGVRRALENLQARIRGNILMALSNQFGGLPLCCGNKSELAMGYCTLYGDSVGALAPIGDLLKTQVYRLCHWYNENFSNQAIPTSILERAPSAELAPGQKDTDSLPPYPILDSILSAHLEEGLDSATILSRGYAPEIVELVFSLLRKAEFKRRQCPPLLRLTTHSFAQAGSRPLVGNYPL